MLKHSILSLVAYFSIVHTNVLYAQSAQNSISAPGTFNFNTVSSVDGNRTRKEVDSDGDGAADRITTYAYDANGYQTRQEVDSDGDSTTEQIGTYAYDANGNLTSIEFDIDIDGKADRITTYTYDAKGNRIRYVQDTDGDGKADRITTYTYDANGNQTSVEQDFDGDGYLEEIKTFTYDANGNQTREEYDINGDGKADRITAYTYDANGNLTRVEYDSDRDGTADEITTYTYDVNGNRTREDYDTDGDDNADYIYTFTYDANGNRTMEENDNNGDGKADEITTYTYDANGNRTRVEYDGNGDDTADIIEIYTYFNTLLCPDLAKGLVHKLLVDIPESGVWRFSLCGSDFQNVMALSSTEHCDSNLFYANDGCINNDATADVRLEEAGKYYLTVGGKRNKDSGNYTLEITRLQGLDVQSFEENLISIYPNPAQNQITIQSNIKMDSYLIFNAVGKIVMNGDFTNTAINIESLNAGIYFIALRDEDNNQTYHKRFVK
jgi:hypothetical protein